MMRPPGNHRAYQVDGWWQIDDRTVRTVALAASRGGVVRDQDSVPAEVRRKSSIYNEFYRKEGIDYCAGWMVRINGERWGFTAQRTHAGGPYTREETQALAHIAPRMNRAALLAVRMREVRARALAEGMAAAGQAAIVLDHRGRCTFVTPACEAMFDAHFGVRDGRLWRRTEPPTLA